MTRPILRRNGLVLLLGLLVLPACATPERPDPWVRMNRGIFQFNEGVDRYALEPVATGWDAVLPEPVQDSVANFFDNLDMPMVFVNDLLQGKPVAAFQDFGRFTINSTIGILGLFDVATIAEVPDNDEDFGQTLAVWGVPSGAYFVIPLLGPSTVRDTAALPVDILSRPHTWFLGLEVTLPLRLVDIVNDRAAFLEAARDNRETALDYYVFVRNAWIQNRETRIRDGRAPEGGATDDLYYLEDEE